MVDDAQRYVKGRAGRDHAGIIAGLAVFIQQVKLAESVVGLRDVGEIDDQAETDDAQCEDEGKDAAADRFHIRRLPIQYLLRLAGIQADYIGFGSRAQYDIAANALGGIIEARMTPESSYLWTLPMFHSQGWCYVWAVTAVGARHVCLDAVRADDIYDLMVREKITTMCGAPTACSMVTDYMKKNVMFPLTHVDNCVSIYLS